jgi:hypothetical protein
VLRAAQLIHDTSVWAVLMSGSIAVLLATIIQLALALGSHASTPPNPTPTQSSTGASSDHEPGSESDHEPGSESDHEPGSEPDLDVW